MMASVFPNDAAQAVVNELVQKTNQAVYKAANDIHKNKVDPFSALIDSMLQGIPLSSWVTQEKVRQNQKTLQNYIGLFHQSIIASFDGWEDLGTGKIIDIRNKQRTIVAEIKNKFNTTKGNHKIEIYREIKEVLEQPEHIGFIGYYVEIIPSGRGKATIYNKQFTPPDNLKGQRADPRDDIRVIDGRSFYEIVTGDKNALAQLYHSLPTMIRNALGHTALQPEQEELFMQLFEKAFP